MRIRQDQKSVKQSKRGWRLWHDETGATFGSPVDLLAALFLFWGLMVMGGVSVTLIKYQLALESSLQYAQAAAMDSNMIDPATKQPIDQELVQAFSQQLPVANQGEAINVYPPSPGQAGPNQLLVSLIPNNGFVTLTLNYGLALPIGIPTWSGTGWTTAKLPPIQEYTRISIYQMW